MKEKEIAKAIENLKMVIRQEFIFNDKRWKRSYWNNPGVYTVVLNIQQIEIIHKALKNLDKQENKTHLQQKWNKMAKEIHWDYEDRMRGKQYRKYQWDINET